MLPSSAYVMLFILLLFRPKAITSSSSTAWQLAEQFSSPQNRRLMTAINIDVCFYFLKKRVIPTEIVASGKNNIYHHILSLCRDWCCDSWLTSGWGWNSSLLSVRHGAVCWALRFSKDASWFLNGFYSSSLHSLSVSGLSRVRQDGAAMDFNNNGCKSCDCNIFIPCLTNKQVLYPRPIFVCEPTEAKRY